MKTITVSHEVGNSPVNMRIPHYHSHYEIYYLKKGERRYFIENRVYDLRAGDFALIPPDMLHKTSGGDFDRYLIDFSPSVLSLHSLQTAKECFKRSAVHIKDENKAETEQLIEQMESSNEAQREELLNKLLVILCRMSNASIPSLSDSETSLIMSIVRHINASYSEDLDVEALAKMAYLTRSHFTRKFKAITGFSPARYINDLRLNHAKELLSNSKLSVTEISIRCGFSSSNYFGDVFRKYYGVSPREWRNK